ncbi:MAG: carotenoid biosynthesis protein [Chitinophagaceae bacterium]|jgi:putative membrane protein|nr:carotenoid biosynthesis protein [Chitinophagaceae bacterium]
MSIRKPYWMKSPFHWAIFLAVLVHFSGAIGIAFFSPAFFVPFTPVNLFLMLLLLILHEQPINFRFVQAFFMAVVVGMITEMIGVNTGLLFGDYSYGEVFGRKLFGVPVLIGINWFCVVYSSNVVARKLNGNAMKDKLSVALLAAAIATAFDWIMEPVAMKLGFWNWRDGTIPFFNYASWFVISFAVSIVFGYLKIQASNKLAPYFLVIQALFFLFLRFTL